MTAFLMGVVGVISSGPRTMALTFPPVFAIAQAAMILPTVT